MTNEEAVAELRDILTNVLDYEDIRTAQAFSLAEKALKKQVPTLLNYISDGEADGNPVYDEAECPSCGYIFDDGDSDWKADFCPHCGQALNWEWEETE